MAAALSANASALGGWSRQFTANANRYSTTGTAAIAIVAHISQRKVVRSALIRKTLTHRRWREDNERKLAVCTCFVHRGVAANGTILQFVPGLTARFARDV